MVCKIPRHGGARVERRKIGKQLGMWQYTQSGVINGIAGEFDFNYSYKNYPEIMKKWGLNGYVAD